MIALKLFVLLQVLGALVGNPIATHFDGSDEVDLSWRLPSAIYPISYKITLETRVHDDGDREFTGMELISLDVREPTNKIVLHSKGLTIEEVLLFTGASIISEIAYYEDETRDFFIIESHEDFQPGMDLNVFIEFRGQLQLEGVGFYRSEYKIDGETRFLATTQFEALHARDSFPCFDGIYARGVVKKIKLNGG